MAERQDEPGAGPGVTCAGCGTCAGSPSITWSAQRGPEGTSWLCQRCTREHLRSIEGRLDEAWW